MAKANGVLVYTANSSNPSKFESQGIRPFLRVPTLGEEFSLSSNGEVYKISRVIHFLFEKAVAEVEVFGVKVDLALSSVF